MEEEPGMSRTQSRTSPWPPFIAIGLAISEVGIFLDIVPLAIGGTLLLAGTIVGILKETDYIENPWRLSTAFSIVLIVLGGVLIELSIQFTQNDSPIHVGTRGEAIAAAGVLLLVGSVAGRYWQRGQY